MAPGNCPTNAVDSDGEDGLFQPEDSQRRALLRREVGEQADLHSAARARSSTPTWVPALPSVGLPQWGPKVGPGAFAASGQSAAGAGGRGRSRFARHCASNSWLSSLAAGAGLCAVLVWACWQRRDSAWPRLTGVRGHTRQLERPWSATSFVWQSFGGDVSTDHGCRGALDVAMDAPSGVLAFPATSEDECRRKCEEMGLDDCTGIEYHHGADNGCLLWSQPVKGIVMRKGVSCLVRVPAGSFSSEADTTCGAPDATSPPRAAHVETELSPESCRSLCLTTLKVSCVAVEHDVKTGGCTIFDEPTGRGRAALGVTCSRFELGALGVSLSSTTATTTLSLTMSTRSATLLASTPVAPNRTATRSKRNRAAEDPTTAVTTATTTSSAIEVCRQPAVGDSCYSNVVSTIRVAKQISPGATPRGLLGKGGACAGVRSSNSFEAFQACLHTEPDFGCAAPCPCHTAKPGERCYQTVVWVMNEGLAQRPDWYPGLGPKSSFEEIQDFLSQDSMSNSSCDERPCVGLPSQSGAASLFCFSIVEPTGYEPEVMEAQLEKGLGIFACDGQVMLSSGRLVIGGPGGQAVRGERGAARRSATAVLFTSAPVGISKDRTAANTQLFLNAWDVVRTSTPFSQYDWTVKVDPDAVLLPERLGQRLLPHTGRNAYVRNCNKFPDSDDFPMMFGSTEIFSRLALQSYFGGVDVCKAKLAWQDWGEDLFMGRCLNLLGVEALDDFEVVSDGVCTGVDCGDERASAFHPFKSKDSWLECWWKTRLGSA